MGYALMLLSPVLGWYLAPIEGNPFPTFAACTVERNLIMRGKVSNIDGEYFSRVRCVPRKRQ